MVKDSGATVRADRLRPLNIPRPLRVETDERGRPVAVGLGGRSRSARGVRGQGSVRVPRSIGVRTPQSGGVGDWLPLPLGEGCPEASGLSDGSERGEGVVPRRVEAVLDRWRIDDEWWRKEVSRMYYHVALEGGQLLTLYRDLTTGCWYGQTSATPLPAERAEPVSAPAFGLSSAATELRAATLARRAG